MCVLVAQCHLSWLGCQAKIFFPISRRVCCHVLFSPLCVGILSCYFFSVWLYFYFFLLSLVILLLFSSSIGYTLMFSSSPLLILSSLLWLYYYYIIILLFYNYLRLVGYVFFLFLLTFYLCTPSYLVFFAIPSSLLSMVILLLYACLCVFISIYFLSLT